MTAAELLVTPETDGRLELVRGKVRKTPFSGALKGSLACELGARLAIHLRRYSDQGQGFARCGYLLACEPDTVRAPDVSFVQRKRLPAGGPSENYFVGAPDLAIEILSLGNTCVEMEEKLEDYFAAGCRMVWIVNPEHRNVTVHRPEHAPLMIHRTDTLDGGDLLPGFRLPCGELFSD